MGSAPRHQVTISQLRSCGQAVVFEAPVPDHFSIQATIAGMADLFKENAMELFRHRILHLPRINGERGFSLRESIREKKKCYNKAGEPFHFTIHSCIPLECSSGNWISSLRLLVSTGLNRTVL